MRAGAPWCTQCYAPVGAPAPPARPEPPAAQPDRVAPAAASTAHPSATWPCTACDRSNELADVLCAACGTPFLAGVHGDRPTVVLPVVGDLLALSPARRTALAVCVVVAVLLVTALLGLLLS